MRGDFSKSVLIGILIEQLTAFSPLIVIGIIAAYFLIPAPIQDRIVLLPSPDGKVGEVVVKSASGEQVLNTAYAGVAVDANGKLILEAASADTVNKRYGVTLEARPPRPRSFTLYFASGSATELDLISKYAIYSIKTELEGRPEPEITVIGHTDTVGGDEANDALSAERATTVRDLLVVAGIRAASMNVAGRGERELIVSTADEVDEPMNRRVEVSVR